mmetsp:Transcript_42565/g.109478  ORF Transcript_42565/g.109478 Transcript_42565/m.109478 type:complete len:117 (-) Transcript_42565:287-637(-)
MILYPKMQDVLDGFASFQVRKLHVFGVNRKRDFEQKGGRVVTSEGLCGFDLWIVWYRKHCRRVCLCQTQEKSVEKRGDTRNKTVHPFFFGGEDGTVRRNEDTQEYYDSFGGMCLDL